MQVAGRKGKRRTWQGNVRRREVLRNTKVGAGVKVQASAVSLRVFGGAKEGDGTEGGVWGMLGSLLASGRDRGPDGEIEKMREMGSLIMKGREMGAWEEEDDGGRWVLGDVR